MDWIILLYFLEFGYSPFYQSVNTLPYEYVQNENIYYVHFDTEVLLLDHLFIGGSTKIFMQPVKDSYQFYPIENDYLFRAGIRYKRFEVGFRHQCNHPVLSYGVKSQGKSYGGFEEFYMRVSNDF